MKKIKFNKYIIIGIILILFAIIGGNYKLLLNYFNDKQEEKMIQETSQLDKIGDSFKKIIITQDLGKPWRTDKGYLVINILDFLLNPSSLDI